MREDPQALKVLCAEHEDWAIQCLLPVTELPWEAFRHPERYPVGGGVGWLRAESAERLGQLIVAVEEMEAGLDQPPVAAAPVETALDGEEVERS